MTFDGPRIINMQYYVAEAWREYGVDVTDLMTWTFAEESEIGEYYERDCPRVRSFGVAAPPPHHRF